MGRMDWKRSRICMILVAVVLLAAMSYVCMEAASVRAMLDASGGKRISGFISRSSFLLEEQADSEEVSGCIAFSESEVAADPAQKRKAAEMRLLLILLLLLLPMPFQRRIEGNWHMMEVIKQRQMLLILYIHRKDGSKME